MMAAGSAHCSGYMHVGCDGAWTMEQRALIIFKKPIIILSSLSPVHIVAPNGKFLGVDCSVQREDWPYATGPELLESSISLSLAVKRLP